MESGKVYPRDLRGYGKNPPFADWPGGAKIAVQFVLNYEEGGENCVLHGDAGSEGFLSEIVGAEAYPARHMSMESIYEYGSRAGGGRVFDEFEERGAPVPGVGGFRWLLSVAGNSRGRSSSWVMRPPAMAGAGSITRISMRKPSESTCA